MTKAGEGGGAVTKAGEGGCSDKGWGRGGGAVTRNNALKSCVKVEVDVPVIHTISVDVKQH